LHKVLTQFCLCPCFLWAVASPALSAPPESTQAGSQSTQSEEKSTSNDTENLEERQFDSEIEVTATLPEMSAVTFPTDELTMSPKQDLVESARDQLGFTSFRRGSINLDPEVRGLQEFELAVVVDGTRTFAAGPGRMDSDMSHVSPHAVEKLEVVKGPYALTWGAGALAAVRVTTIQPAFGSELGAVKGQAGLRYGDNGSRSDLYGGVWGSNERLRYRALANGRSGDDYEAGGGEVFAGDYQSYEGLLGLGYRPNDRWIVEASGGYQRQDDIDYPGRLLDATFFKTQSYALEANWTPSAAGVDEAFGQLYLNDKEHLMNNDNKPTAEPNPDRIPPFPIQVDLPTESNTLGGRLHAGGANERWTWKLGGDFYQLQQAASRTVSNRSAGAILFEDIVWPDAEIDDLGIYGQGIRTLAKTSLGATIRIDFVDTSAGTVSDFFASTVSTPLDQSDTNLSAALSGTTLASPQWRISYGIGRAVRSASALERYSDRFPSTKFQSSAEFLGDPGLEPEISHQVDLGLDFTGSRSSLGVSTFYRVIDNYITVQPDPAIPKRLPLSPPVVFRYVNGDQATFYGGEGWAQGRAGSWFQFRGSLSYVHGEDDQFDEPAYGIPPLLGRIMLRAEQPSGRFWVELNTLIADDQDRVADARFELPTPGYTVYDLVGAVRFGSGWRIRVGVQNITDKRYSNHLNALDPFRRERILEIGRNVFTAIEVRF